MPVKAVRRLLEGTEAAPGTFILICDADLSASDVLRRGIIWDQPEMLFECPSCRGTGQYVGLSEVETCKVCGGRKLVAW